MFVVPAGSIPLSALTQPGQFVEISGDIREAVWNVPAPEDSSFDEGAGI